MGVTTTHLEETCLLGFFLFLFFFLFGEVGRLASEVLEMSKVKSTDAADLIFGIHLLLWVLYRVAFSQKMSLVNRLWLLEGGYKPGIKADWIFCHVHPTLLSSKLSRENN